MATTSQTLTNEQKIAVIERGMARLPLMGVEAQWAFGVQLSADFVVPPIWVHRVILMTFNVDPDAQASNESIDPVKVSKMVGSLLGLAQGAELVFRPKETSSTSGTAELTEEKLKQGVSDAAMGDWVHSLAPWQVISHMTFSWEASIDSAQRC